MPKFALIDDVAAPFFMPLSPWRRVSYLFGFVWTAIFYFRHGGGEGWLHYMALSLAIVFALVGSALVMWQRDLSRAPLPEDTVSSYRAALASEFDRQYRKEKLIVIVLFGGGILLALLLFVGHLLQYRSADPGLLTAGALFAVLLAAGMRSYVRAAESVRSRLKED